MRGNYKESHVLQLMTIKSNIEWNLLVSPSSVSKFSARDAVMGAHFFDFDHLHTCLGDHV